MCADWLDVGRYIYLGIVVQTLAKYRLIKGVEQVKSDSVVEHLHYFLIKTLSTELLCTNFLETAPVEIKTPR